MPTLKRAALLSPENVRGTDIHGKAVVLAKTQPQQLALFQTFFPDDHNDHYSNTIELYDAILKYVTNPKLVDAMREGGKYLPLLERRFHHRGEVFTVTMRPARLKDREGREKEYLSLSRLNHRLPGCETHPEVVQGATACHHPIADALLPQADPVFDDPTTLDTTVDMLDAQPAVVQRLMRPLLRQR